MALRHSLGPGQVGAVLAFLIRYLLIRRQGNDEPITIGARFFEVRNVPGMQRVETAIGQDDPHPPLF
jgi:hypothetical protein